MSNNNHLVEELTKLYSEDKTGKIAGICSKFRISFQEAEDIYQKAFIKAFNNLDKFKGESSLKTWMFRIVQNTFLDHARKLSTKRERNQASLTFGGDDDGDDFFRKIKDENAITPSESCENSDNNITIGADIDETLEKLSSQHQRVINLVFKNGFSYEKTAKTMKCSIGTVMSRVFYARKNFILNYSRINKIEKKRKALVIEPS
jgi:RNA polymerase sigma-70 factor (ECF subfamily)